MHSDWAALNIYNNSEQTSRLFWYLVLVLHSKSTPTAQTSQSSANFTDFSKPKLTHCVDNLTLYLTLPTHFKIRNLFVSCFSFSWVGKMQFYESLQSKNLIEQKWPCHPNEASFFWLIWHKQLSLLKPDQYQELSANNHGTVHVCWHDIKASKVTHSPFICNLKE